MMTTRMPGRVLMCATCALAFLACRGQVTAEMGEPVGDDKKLIGWACDRINTNEVRRRIAKLEETAFDGLILTAYPDEYRKQGVPFTKDGRYALWFGGKKHSRDDFKEAIADLTATEFQRFTDNFIDFQTTVRGKPTAEEANLDWFDDKWSVIADNGAVAAYVAKTGGLKGLLIDVEHYAGGVGPWRYPFGYKEYAGYMKEAGRTPRTLDECIAQVRTRGRQFMQAVTAVYPDLTIIVIPDTGRDCGPLVRPFIEGMLEIRGKATFVDGAEQGYPMMTYNDFSRYRTHSTRSTELYKDMGYGFGVWWDWGRKDWRSPEGVKQLYRDPANLEHSLYNALTVADRYVWLFSYGAYLDSIWWNSGYDTGWGTAIPDGYRQAIRNSRKPHDLAWTPGGRRVLVNFAGVVLVEGEKITGGEVNLLANGDFEVWHAGPDAAPDGWVLVGATPVVSRDEVVPRLGRYSAQLTTASIADTGHVSLDQSLPAQSLAGKTLTLGAWVKTNASGIGNLQIVGVGSCEPPPVVDQWQFLNVTGTVPKDATGDIVFRLRVFVMYSPK